MHVVAKLPGPRFINPPRHVAAVTVYTGRPASWVRVMGYIKMAAEDAY